MTRRMTLSVPCLHLSLPLSPFLFLFLFLTCPWAPHRVLAKTIHTHWEKSCTVLHDRKWFQVYHVVNPPWPPLLHYAPGCGKALSAFWNAIMKWKVKQRCALSLQKHIQQIKASGNGNGNANENEMKMEMQQNEIQLAMLLMLSPLQQLLWGKVAAYVVAGALAICQNGSATAVPKPA